MRKSKINFSDPHYLNVSESIIGFFDRNLDKIVEFLSKKGCNIHILRKFRGKHSCIWQISLAIPTETVDQWEYSTKELPLE